MSTGNGTTHGYYVEVRAIAGVGIQKLPGDFVVAQEWKRLPVRSALEVGVPRGLYCREAEAVTDLVSFAAGRAAMATRYRKSAGVTGVIVKEINRGSLAGHATGARETGRLMGIDWMRRDELTQAIPPAYTEWVGHELRRALGIESVA